MKKESEDGGYILIYIWSQSSRNVTDAQRFSSSNPRKDLLPLSISDTVACELIIVLQIFLLAAVIH